MRLRCIKVMSYVFAKTHHLLMAFHDDVSMYGYMSTVNVVEVIPLS